MSEHERPGKGKGKGKGKNPMADYPGALVYPEDPGLYGIYDAGTVGAPPPTDYPGAYAYPLCAGLYGQMDGGPRFPIWPSGKERGGSTFPYNPNVRGIFKRNDPKVKPI